MAALIKSRKGKEGIKVDTLFLNGTMDCDTYYRYLRDYAKQIRRHGVGNRAFGTIENGKVGYIFTDRKDYTGYETGECYHFRPEAEWYQLFCNSRPEVENRKPLKQKQTSTDHIRWWLSATSTSSSNVIDDWHRSIEETEE